MLCFFACFSPRFFRRFCLVALALLCPASVRAITIDRLTDTQQIVVVGPSSNLSSSVVVPANNALGGSRQVEVRLNEGTSVTNIITNGFLAHSQNANTKGYSLMVWDGNPTPGLQTSGLGGLDLTADDGTAFRFSIEGYDFPNSQPLRIVVTIYDASDPLKVSTGTLLLNSAVAQPTLKEINFSDFVKVGAEGASFKNVGAVTVLIDGTLTPAHDLTLDYIGTNGRCTHIPVNRFVLDQCGDCNGNNVRCSDCEGVPNGTKIAGTGCSTGALGTCGEGSYSGAFPSCRCIQNAGASNEVCDAADNDCDGMMDDGLGVGESCTIGTGACTNTGVKSCGVSGTTICSAAAGSPSEEICDSIDNDCDGTIDEGNPKTGPNIDPCGVCGGNGSSCLDCKGVPFGPAAVDVCGICNGDGSTCVSCSSKDISKTLKALDGGAKQQESMIIRAIAEYRTTAAGRKDKKFIKDTLTLAHQLQIRNWTISWMLPQISTVCKHATFCVTTSNVSVLSEYRQHNQELKDLGLQVIAKISTAKNKKIGNKERGLKSWAERQFKENLELSFTVPETQYTCTK